jgi:hypothetical protein
MQEEFFPGLNKERTCRKGGWEYHGFKDAQRFALTLRVARPASV